AERDFEMSRPQRLLKSGPLRVVSLMLLPVTLKPLPDDAAIDLAQRRLHVMLGPGFTEHSLHDNLDCFFELPGPTACEGGQPLLLAVQSAVQLGQHLVDQSAALHRVRLERELIERLEAQQLLEKELMWA